jgi:hypothetical protein
MKKCILPLLATMSMTMTSCFLGEEKNNENHSGGIVTPNQVAITPVEISFHILDKPEIQKSISKAELVMVRGLDTVTQEIKLDEYSFTSILDSAFDSSSEIKINFYDKNNNVWFNGSLNINLSTDSTIALNILLEDLKGNNISLYGSIRRIKKTSTSTPIFANLPWQSNGDVANVGDTLCYSSTGSWKANEAHNFIYGGEGTGRLVSDIYALPGGTEGALLIRTGTSKPQEIGGEGCVIAESSGKVFFAINDAHSMTPIPQGNALVDNSGYLDVKRISSTSPSSSESKLSATISSSAMSSSISSSSSFKYSSSSGLSSSETEKLSFNVQANLPWQISKWTLNAGENICFKATGQWKGNGSHALHGPEGTLNFGKNGYALAGAHESALLARIPGSTPKEIGSAGCYTADKSGTIEFAINDVLEFEYQSGAALNDNSGLVTVTINNN